MNIMSGANLKVELGTYSATNVVATTWTEVPEVASFTTSGFESTVIDVVTFNSAYNRKLLGTKSVPSIELSVNYIADNTVHKQLETLADNQTRTQVKISYFEDSTRTTGFYVIYNCFVASTVLSGDKDAVVTKAFTLEVDQGAIGGGVLPIK